MTILVDKEIIALCDRPQWEMTTTWSHRHLGIDKDDHVEKEMINITQRQRIDYHIPELVGKNRYVKDMPTERVTREFRELTQEEAHPYKAMIFPFVAEQVREIPTETKEDFHGRMRIIQDKLAVEFVAGDCPPGVFNDWIAQIGGERHMRHPGGKVISYGTSSMGYDVRVQNRFFVFTNALCRTIDPKNFDPKNYVEVIAESVLIPPNGFVLAVSMEYFQMPDDVAATVLGKSTYARCGINCLATPLEPGWEGYITLEFSNSTPSPVLMYAHEGAAQVIFHKGNQRPKVTYGDRGGKYQGQHGITLPTA